MVFVINRRTLRGTTMALIDKIDRDAKGNVQIPVHEFSAALLLWALGEITRANVITVFNLEPADEAQLDQLAAHYTGLSASDKQSFHSRMEAAGVALQGGYISKAKYISFLGMT